jgi:hypothetical protein
MRLLQLNNNGEFSLAEYVGKNIPPYAILSHTWGVDHEEVTFRDLIEGMGKSKIGYRKLAFCAKQAAQDCIYYFWVDTCCINKSSSAELSEAINSMFQWYQRADKCYVYLSDVSIGNQAQSDLSSQQTWKADFRRSRWFTRGWTLQELLAPKLVEFFSSDGKLLGDKISLVQEIYDITGISVEVLKGSPLPQFNVDERMSWAETRETIREEDAAYSLLGIFDVHMPLIYGEGRRNAFIRLQREIQESSGDYRSDFFEFVLQTGTALHETDDTFKFLMGDKNKDSQPDLFVVKKSGTVTNSTEIYVLSGASGFKTFTTETGTGLHETSTAQFDFTLIDWNGDGTLDLVAIKKNGTGTKSTEVHILSGASNYQDFILQTGTALHETDDTFAFAMGKWGDRSKPDLFAIKKSKTGIEVHVLSGVSGFQTLVLQTGTGLHETDATFDFAVTDWNGDGRPDLVAVKKSNSSSCSTEVYVLSGVSNYKNFILHSEMTLHETDGTFEFMVTDWTRTWRPNLVAIKKKNTGSNSTEVHIMAGRR